MDSDAFCDRPFILANESPKNFRKDCVDKKLSDKHVPYKYSPPGSKSPNQKRRKLFVSPLLSRANRFKSGNDTPSTASYTRLSRIETNSIVRSNLISTMTKSVEHLSVHPPAERTAKITKSRRSSSAPDVFKEKHSNTPIKISIRIKPSFVDDRILQSDQNGELKLSTANQEYNFNFGHVFDDQSNDADYCQQRIYDYTARNYVQKLLEGFNCCLMAYGPTGSGKTYSMMGTKLHRGIISRFCAELFTVLNACETPGDDTVEVVYYEIYNERLYDLLNEKDSGGHLLKIRENPQTGPYVEGLQLHKVQSFDEIIKLLNRGNAKRTKASTQKNDQSSRSHAVFNLKLKKTLVKEGGVDELFTQNSSICFVDLAGSEKISTFVDSKETSTINKSLCFLGKVILQLGTKRQQHISYRDSVLTWLLKDYLGGNAQTHMLVTVRRTKDSAEETLNTLRFASHAKSVVCRPIKETFNLKDSTVRKFDRDANFDTSPVITLHVPLLPHYNTIAVQTVEETVEDTNDDCGPRMEEKHIQRTFADTEVSTDLSSADISQLQNSKDAERLWLINAGILKISALQATIGQSCIILLNAARKMNLDTSFFTLCNEKGLSVGSSQFTDIQIENIPPFCCKLSQNTDGTVSLSWLTATESRGEVQNGDFYPCVNGAAVSDDSGIIRLHNKDCIRLNHDNYLLIWIPASNDDFLNYFWELEAAKAGGFRRECEKSIHRLQSRVSVLEEELESYKLTNVARQEELAVEKDLSASALHPQGIKETFSSVLLEQHLKAESPTCSTSNINVANRPTSFNSNLLIGVEKLIEQFDPSEYYNKKSFRRSSSLLICRWVKEANDILSTYKKHYFEFSYEKALDENSRLYTIYIRLTNTKLKVYSVLTVESFRFRLDNLRSVLEIGNVTGENIEEILMNPKDVWHQVYQNETNLYSLALVNSLKKRQKFD